MPEKRKRRVTNGSVNPGVIANLIMLNYHFVTTIGEKKMYYYADGVYRYPGAEELIASEARKIYENNLRKNFANEVVFQVQTQTYKEVKAFDSDVNIVNVKNGLFNLRTGEMTPHTPEYLSMIQLPITYDPSAECPNIKAFFNDVLKPENVLTVEELFGYCLLRDQPYQKAFLLYGEGENGKSKLLDLLRVFLGKEDNCSSISWQMLEEHRYAVSQLRHRLANIYADLKTRAIYDTGNFKSLTGQDTVTAEDKYQDQYQFKSFAKLIFSCNQPPIVNNDDSKAFWRRWQLIQFPNSFPPEKRDVNILDKLTTEEELSGLLNVAIEGLHRLRNQGYFTSETTPDITSKDYNRMADSVKYFLSDGYCQFDYRLSIEVDELYNYYKQFCDIHSLRLQDKARFGKRLVQIYPDIEKRRKMISGTNKVYYEGIGCDGIQLLIETPGTKFEISQEYKDLSPEVQKVMMAIDEELEDLKKQGKTDQEIEEYAQKAFDNYFEVTSNENS